ncbi:MAG: T9SS type A sorting domain-containing protein [Flavobacterium sp.]|nr:MAG: T9SS type A sorting domain-containing protein [Flavobacterium sp.]
MKKITFLFLLVLLAIKGHGQCLGNYSLSTLASNNSGFEQQISAYAYTTGDFATITNLIVGSDYTFTCRLGATEKYITVTDANNVVIEHGASPLLVSSINYSSVKVHYTDNADCGGSPGNHVVSVKIELTCPVPTGLTIYELGTTSAIFTWTPEGSETAWEVIALPATSPAPANNLTEGVAVVNDTPEFTGVFLPATAYKFYYRAVCSDSDKSPWNSSTVFTTLCEDVTYFSEGFDGGSVLPVCFSKVGTQGTLTIQNESSASSLPNVVVMGSGSILSLPAVSNFSDATHRIKFKVRSIYTVGGSVEFGYLLDPQDATSFVALETFPTNSLTEFIEYTFEPDGNTQTGNFAFKQVVQGNNSIVLDDIVWEPIPVCPDVTSLKTDAFTSATASLSWTSEDSSWEIVYGPATTTANPNGLIPQTLENPNATLSNLAASTTYKVWVRSVCGENAFGAWIGPKIITTTCSPVTTFSENFNASSSIPDCFKRVGTGGNAYIQSSQLNISSYEDGNADNVMSYGIISLPPVSNAGEGTQRLKFLMKSSGSIGGVVELGYMENPVNVDSFTAIQTFTSNSTTPQTVIYIPTAGTITAEVMAFRHTGNPSYGIVIDDIVWETAPNCADVGGIQASQIANASATISWTGNSETNWQVAYGATTVADLNNLTPVDVSDVSNTILSDLDASTTYKVWVRSNCGTADFGAWIGPIQFTTSCDPVTAFSEDFDASTSVPACWSNAGTGTLFIQTDNNNNSAYISSYGTSFGILAARPVSNVAAGTHRLKFKAKASYDLGGVIEVGYLTSYNQGSTFVSLQSFTPTSTTVYDEFYANLGSLPTTSYLALRHSGTSFNAVLLDNVVWEALPTCEEVGELSVGAFTNTTATLSWEAEYSTAWETVYTEVGDDTDPSDLTPYFSEVEMFTFTDLLPDTLYKAWVRSVCEDELYSAWVGPFEFKTTCDPLSVSWIEDFESIEVPNLPECWTKGNGNWVVIDQTNPFDSTTPNSGTNYMRCYNGAVNSHMWTPGFELEANTPYDFATFVQGDGYDGWSVAMVYNSIPKSEGAIQFGETYEVPAGTGIQPYAEMRRVFVPTVSGTYFFAVKVNESSTGNTFYIAFDDFSVEQGTLSTPTFGANNFKAYPNPVKDILNVSYTENISGVEVYNLLGQKVATKAINANNGQLDMSGLAAGSYLVKVTAGNQVQTIKVIKQ